MCSNGKTSQILSLQAPNKEVDFTVDLKSIEKLDIDSKHKKSKMLSFSQKAPPAAEQVSSHLSIQSVVTCMSCHALKESSHLVYGKPFIMSCCLQFFILHYPAAAAAAAAAVSAQSRKLCDLWPTLHCCAAVCWKAEAAGPIHTLPPALI